MVATAGVTHDAVLNDVGILIAPNTLRKYDITNFSPAVRNTTPRYNDFSLAQFWVMNSWHQGRGAFQWENPYAFYDSTNVDTRIRNQMILAPLQNATVKDGVGGSVAGNPVLFRLFTTSANLWMFTGGASRQGFQWDNTNSTWDVKTVTLAADPTDAVEFQGNIFLAQGEANNMRKNIAGTWSAADVPARLLHVFNNLIMYRADNVNEIYWTTVANPSSTDWQGPIYVGDTNTNIRALEVYDGKLYIGKDDGLYVLQDQRAYQLLDVSWGRDSNNFANMKSWNGAIYFPILDGFYRLIGTTLQAIGPDRGAAGIAELGNIRDADAMTFKSLPASRTGRIVDIAPTDSFLYVCVDGGTAGTSQVLAYNNTGWHQLLQGAASNKRILAAFHTGVLATTGSFSTPRMWYGYDTDCYNIILPFGTEDPYDYASETYATTGVFYSSRFDADLANVAKEWQFVDLYSEGLSSSQTVQIAYQLDDLKDNTTEQWQNLLDANGAAYVFSFSPYQRIKLPENTVSRSIQLRVTLVRGGTTTLTPKVKAIVTQYMVRPDVRHGWQVVSITGKNIRNPYTRQKETRDPREWLQLFDRMRASRSRMEWDDGLIEPGITNHVLNPQFRVDSNADGIADNWNAVGAPTTSLSIPLKVIGLRSQKAICDSINTQGIETDTITLTVGTRYVASAYVYVTSGDKVFLEARNQNAGTTIAQSPVVLLEEQGGWVRLEIAFVAPHASFRLRVVRNSANATVETSFYVSAAQVEALSDKRFRYYQSYASTYCDGEQPRGRWSGAPHASTSVRDSTYKVFITNINEAETKRPGILEIVQGIGAEHRIVMSLAEIE